MSYSNKEKLKEAGITEEDLQSIRDDFELKKARYEQAAQSIAGILLKTDGVHSVRYRLKDPNHLEEKIFRKKIDNKDRVITRDTYESEIMDLAGVRVLHLFKMTGSVFMIL